jgi:hypothetical protein
MIADVPVHARHARVHGWDGATQLVTMQQQNVQQRRVRRPRLWQRASEPVLMQVHLRRL